MPTLLSRDITARMLVQIRAATANDSARTIEAVICTEDRVLVTDKRSYDLIDEVLLASVFLATSSVFFIVAVIVAAIVSFMVALISFSSLFIIFIFLWDKIANECVRTMEVL